MKNQLVLLGLLGLVGCAQEPPTAPPAPTAPAAPTAPRPQMGAPQPAAPDAPLTPSPILDDAIAAAEKVGDKAAQAQAYVKRGFTRLGDIKAGTAQRYGGALTDFRKALTLDPTSARARRGLGQAESALKAANLPLPK